MGSNQSSFRLHYMKGDSTGMRTAEAEFGSAKVLVFKRDELQELKKELNDLPKSGVYVLSGQKVPATGKMPVYIGKGQIFDRLRNHNADKSKDFWQETAVLASKSFKLSTGHLDNLEALLIDRFEKSRDCHVENDKKRSNNPGNLEKYHQEIMVQLLNDAILLFDALNSNVFRKVTQVGKTNRPRITKNNNVNKNKRISKIKTKNNGSIEHNVIFSASSKTYDAKMRYFYSDKNVEVLKGSKVAAISEHSSSDSLKKIRELKLELIKKGIIVEKNYTLVLIKNFNFNSSSQAANFVSGSIRSGPEFWKIQDDKTNRKITLKEYNNQNYLNKNSPIFSLGKDKYNAKIEIYPNRECMILKGSKARKEHGNSAPEKLIKKREQLLNDNTLAKEDDHLIFTRDYPCTSPNIAATIVTGVNTNIYITLKLSDGTTYGEWLEMNK